MDCMTTALISCELINIIYHLSFKETFFFVCKKKKLRKENDFRTKIMFCTALSLEIELKQPTTISNLNKFFFSK